MLSNFSLACIYRFFGVHSKLKNSLSSPQNTPLALQDAYVERPEIISHAHSKFFFDDRDIDIEILDFIILTANVHRKAHKSKITCKK